MTADNVIRLPVRRPPRDVDALFAVLTERIARLERIEQAAQRATAKADEHERRGYGRIALGALDELRTALEV